MSSLLKSSFLAGLALSLALGVTLVMQTTQLDASVCCIGAPACDPFGIGFRTATVSGSDIDCPWAIKEFNRNIEDLCGMGTCQVSYDDPGGCTFDGTTYTFTAEVQYKCMGCPNGFQQCY